MGAIGPYDSALQMFVEQKRDADQSRLEEVRWRVENGRAGVRPVLGRPTGMYAKAFGYETPDGEAIRVNVISNKAPEGVIQAVRSGERIR